MKQHRKGKRSLVVLALLLVGAVTAVGSYAYWTNNGSGTGSATADTTVTLKVNQTSTPGLMYPGGPAQALSGNFDNPNTAAVTISSVTAAVTSVTPLAGSTFAGNGKPDCAVGDFTVGGAAAGSTVPAGTGVGSWSGLTIQLKNTAANQDNCKGAKANITYTANP